MAPVVKSACDCIVHISREDTPSTVASDADYCPGSTGVDAFGDDDSACVSASVTEATDTTTEASDTRATVDDEIQMPRQLGPGLYSDDDVRGSSETRQPGSSQSTSAADVHTNENVPSEQEAQEAPGDVSAKGDKPGSSKDPDGQETPGSAMFSP